MRRTLAGSTSTTGEAQRGDLDRELERIGIAADGSMTPLDALPNPTPAERRAYSVAVAQLSALALKERPAARAEIVERAAYSWINRLLALRAIEARGLIDETLRNNPDYDGLSEALFVLRQSEPHRTAGADAGWWAVIEDACTAQAASLPGLFSTGDPNVALRPSTPALLRCVAVVGGAPSGFTLEEADAAFADPDAIGWAYQFYQEQAKALVYAKLGSGGKVSTRAEIAAATQLFTEPYMVKWLLQNSLGRSYHELFPDTRLTASWEYYITPDKLEPPAYMGLVSLTVMDPCMGSGHFLREAFDMLAAMYREQHPDMPAAEIADNILQKHLHGIDIDPRASQLAALTLYLRAWETVRDERRAQRKPGPGTLGRVQMNLATTPTNLDAGSLERHLRRHPEDRVLKPLLEGIFQALEQADILGSLLRPGEHLDAAIAALQKPQNMTLPFDDDSDLQQTVRELANQDSAELKRMLLVKVAESFAKESGDASDVAANLFGHEAVEGLRLLQLLDQRYGVVVTNPPYMGSKNMGTAMRDYIHRFYPVAKPDLYVTFIIRCLELSLAAGRSALVTQQSWMFSSGLAPFRAGGNPEQWKGFLRTSRLESLAHLGPGGFGEISGEVVNTVLLVSRPQANPKSEYTLALRVVREQTPELKQRLLKRRPSRNVFHFDQASILHIPGAPVAYWLGARFYELLTAGRVLEQRVAVFPGLKTGDDARFLRFHWEVPVPSNGWVPYSKGGQGYGKWHGQNEYCLDWRRGKAPFREYRDSRQPYSDYYQKDGYTYSSASKGALSVRHLPPGSIFGSKGPGIFLGEDSWASALLNARISSYFVRSMAVGLDILVENVRALPLPELDRAERDLLGRYCFLAEEFRRRELSSIPTDMYFDSSVRSFVVLPEEALRLTLEGELETRVSALYELDADSADVAYLEVGAPCGWLPLLHGRDNLPDISPSLVSSSVLDGLLGARKRLSLPEGQIRRLLENLADSFAAGSGAPDEDPDMEQHGGEGDETEGAGASAGIPLPPEGFLEELSQKLQIHPISVYWLLEELRAEGVRCKPEEQRLLEDRLSVMVLRLLGHRWPKQIEAGEAVPAWADADGIIPLTTGLGAEEQTLADRLRARLRTEDGEVGAQQAEALLIELTGTGLEEWLRKRFFTRHVRQFKYRPIAWHLASSPQGAGGGKRGGGRRAPAFECMLYYHACESDVLARIRTRYVEPLLRTERRRAEDARRDNDDTTAAIATDRIHELEEFGNRLRQVEEAGFTCDDLDKLPAGETLDRWSGDGFLPPTSYDDLAHNERAWRVDINDGVRVNIAPLQMAGVLAGDVLKAADAKKAIADRARWRSDERRWVREGKLPRCGWMGEDVPESPAWTERAPQREAERLKLEQKRKAVMDKLGSSVD
jgi:hypothetical protein